MGYKEIYYKELAHMVMEAEKAPQSTVSKLETQESWWCKFPSVFQGLRTKRTNGVNFSPSAREHRCPSLKTVKQRERESVNSATLHRFVLLRP